MPCVTTSRTSARTAPASRASPPAIARRTWQIGTRSHPICVIWHPSSAACPRACAHGGGTASASRACSSPAMAAGSACGRPSRRTSARSRPHCGTSRAAASLAPIPRTASPSRAAWGQWRTRLARHIHTHIYIAVCHALAPRVTIALLAVALLAKALLTPLPPPYLLYY